jgi:hypothetical protein
MSTVGELITQLGVSAHTTWNAAMDGKLVYNNDLLSEGAVLMLFPVDGEELKRRGSGRPRR